MDKFRIIKNNSVVDGILDDWATVIGKNYNRYRNHVYRVFNYSMAFNDYRNQDEATIAFAACFHDIIVWSEHKFENQTLNIEEVKEYIANQELGVDLHVVSLMIKNHHKVRSYVGEEERLVENFRKADLTDVSKGRVRFGLKQHSVQLCQDTFAYKGFHSAMRRKTISNFIRRPFRPLPMPKW